MIVATWKTKGLYNASAQKVAEEIAELGDCVKPSEIVDKARNEESELHKCFEWRDDIAAEKYRIHQARILLCNLVIDRKSDLQKAQEAIRLMYKTTGEGYKPISLILADKDEYRALLERAYRELAVFKSKYKMISELKDVFDLIPDRL